MPEQFDAKFGQVYRGTRMRNVVVMVVANIDSPTAPDYQVINLTGGDEGELDLWGMFVGDWERVDEED